MGVVIVPPFHIRQHLLVAHPFPAGNQFIVAAPGAVSRAGRQKYLHLRTGQHHSTDVAPIHKHIVILCQCTLGVQQERAHRRVCRNMGCSHGHLLGADEAGNVLPVQKHMLHTVHIAHLQPDARQERRHGILILGVCAAAQHMQPDGTVHGAGIDINVAKLCGKPPRQTGFARTGRAVDGNGNHIFLLFPPGRSALRHAPGHD